ncbi:MAG: hypothetical protein IT173_06700 [Acidobacteria bacterium]|nr:hypothetical protein [Acidobacteriota bacterium]
MKLLFPARKAITVFALTAFLTTASMVALAAPGRIVAELNVSGRTQDGEAPAVFVNGETSRSGRSVFSSSTVSTPDEATAVLSVAGTGRIELAPNSSVNLVFDDQMIDAELTAGTLTVLGASGTVKVRTNDGKDTVLNPGESISAEGSNGARKQSSKKDYTWVWLLVAAGAAVAVIVAVSSGGGDDVVSPNR